MKTIILTLILLAPIAAVAQVHVRGDYNPRTGTYVAQNAVVEVWVGIRETRK